MIETLAVFQLARFWLKADAEANICERHHHMEPKRAGQPHDAANYAKERAASASAASTRSPDKPSRPRPSCADAATRSTNCSSARAAA